MNGPHSLRLVVPEQVFVELLPWTQAGVLDGNRGPGLIHQLARHVDDPDRLTHLEDQRLAGGADRQAAPPGDR